MNKCGRHYHYSHVIIVLRRLSNLCFPDFAINSSIEKGLLLRLIMQRGITASFLALLFCLAPLSGCFGEDGDSGISEGDVVITPAKWIGGEFQAITIAAE